MPCNSETIQTSILEKARPDLLEEAARAAGLIYKQQGQGKWAGMTIYADYEEYTSGYCQCFISWKEGAPMGVNLYGDDAAHQAKAMEIKRNYAGAAVHWAAKKNGWTVQQQTAPNKFTLTRR